ncbi:hypothetical protein AAC387_Pa05g1334 [Persea americana]
MGPPIKDMTRSLVMKNVFTTKKRFPKPRVGRLDTTRKYIFSIGLIAAADKIRCYSILIVVAKGDSHCNAIFELLLPAAFSMFVAKNIDPMAPRSRGKFFIFIVDYTAAANFLEGKLSL